MAFSFNEIPESRTSTVNPPTMTLRYKAVGEHDDTTVRVHALTGSPPVFHSADLGTLYRQDIRLDPDGHKQYIVDVPYAGKKRETGNIDWTFDTTGATVHITHSKEHIKRYPTDGNPHKGSIGVTKDGDVKGADIVIPAMKLTVQFTHPKGIVTLAHAKQLARITGTTNLYPFLDEFDAGEMLYLGSTGGNGTDSAATLGYQFAASENVTDLKFGDIVDIVKDGHHLAWVETKKAVVDGKPATQPEFVHIERAYDPIDFASVFGWG